MKLRYQDGNVDRRRPRYLQNWTFDIRRAPPLLPIRKPAKLDTAYSRLIYAKNRMHLLKLSVVSLSVNLA